MKDIAEFNKAFEFAEKTKNKPEGERNPYPTNTDFINVVKKYSGNVCLNLEDNNLDILIRPIKGDIFTELNRPNVSKQATFFKINSSADDSYIVISPFIKE